MIEPAHSMGARNALLSIGSDVGGTGPWQTAIAERLGRLSRMSASTSGSASPGDLRMQIVFQVPGPLLMPKAEAITFRRYQSRTRLLVIVAVVPSGADPSRLDGYLADVLEQARGHAEAVAVDHPAKQNAAPLLGRLAELGADIRRARDIR